MGPHSVAPILTDIIYKEEYAIWSIDYFIALRATQEFFTSMETSPLPVKGYKFRPMVGAQGFEQGEIFMKPHLLWLGASVFPVSSEGPPDLVASYETQGDVEDLF
jgi:hypothetical protein